MKTRKELQQEFIDIRNSLMRKGSSTRERNIYFDWLSESDILAEIKTDADLLAYIERMKGN